MGGAGGCECMIPMQYALRRRMMESNAKQWTLEVTPYESGSNYASVSINGNTLDAGAHKVIDGTIAHFEAKSSMYGAIYLNNERVVMSTMAGEAVTYDLEIHANYTAIATRNVSSILRWDITTQ